MEENMPKRKTAKFNDDGIGTLAKDKPVVYKLLDEKGNNIYTSIAKRGQVEQRLKEHLPGAPDAIRGTKKVQIQQKNSIDEARQTETRIIKGSKPKYNK